MPTLLEKSNKHQVVHKSKKRRLPPEETTDSGRHANMFAQADELKEEALAVLHSTTNKKRKQSVID